MSHIRRKIKYVEEGLYGDIHEHYLYCDVNNCNDITTLYYEDGTPIFSYNDTLENNLGDAIIKLVDNIDDGNIEVWNINDEII